MRGMRINVSETKKITIKIPADQDGYILLKCPYCGNTFKIAASDYVDDRNLHIYCPSCGLTSPSYITDDVAELANTKICNYAEEIIYQSFKNIERKNNGPGIKFKIDKPKREYEKPIRTVIDTLEIAEFNCCKKQAKIKPLLKFTGAYCPFCGVKNDEIE